MTKISDRINQIEHSLQQAQQMLESMDRFKHLVVSIFLSISNWFVFSSLQPGTQEQSEKLRVIIANLEEQKAGYVNLLNLITVNESIDIRFAYLINEKFSIALFFLRPSSWDFFDMSSGPNNWWTEENWIHFS